MYTEADDDDDDDNDNEQAAAYGHAAAGDECEKRIKITSILWYVVFKHLIQNIWLNGCNKSTFFPFHRTHSFSPLWMPSAHSRPFIAASFIHFPCVSLSSPFFRMIVWFPHQFNNMHSEYGYKVYRSKTRWYVLCCWCPQNVNARARLIWRTYSLTHLASPRLPFTLCPNEWICENLCILVEQTTDRDTAEWERTNEISIEIKCLETKHYVNCWLHGTEHTEQQ